MLFTLIAVAFAVLGFISGSLYIFSAAVGYLALKMYPVLIIILVIGGIDILAARHYLK